MSISCSNHAYRIREQNPMVTMNFSFREKDSLYYISISVQYFGFCYDALIHQQLACLFDSLFKLTTKKPWKLHIDVRVIQWSLVVYPHKWPVMLRASHAATPSWFARVEPICQPVNPITYIFPLHLTWYGHCLLLWSYANITKCQLT